MKKPSGRKFSKLVGIMARLRAPGGCPWDRKQSHATLLKYMYSEADEVARAVRKKDWDNLCEELGDLLLQVVFHAEVARSCGRFDIDDVIDGISAKLVRRHPHVFGGSKLKTAGQVVAQWEAIKKIEKLSRRGSRTGRKQPRKRV